MSPSKLSRSGPGSGTALWPRTGNLSSLVRLPPGPVLRHHGRRRQWSRGACAPPQGHAPGPRLGSPDTHGVRDIPEGERAQMPLPQVNERIKEVPAQALRAVFAGIGQVLLVADKIRNRAVEQVSGTTAATTTTAATAPPREAPPTARPAAPSPAPAKRPVETAPAKPQASAAPAKPPAETAPAKPPAEPDSARRRSLDETGNVRLISPDDEAAQPPAGAPPTPELP